MRFKALWLMVTLDSGCATVAPVYAAEDVIQQGNLHTLSLIAGDQGSTTFAPNFVVSAERACGKNRYTVLEKSKNPSTIRHIPGLQGTGRFFWVVRCDAVAH